MSIYYRPNSKYKVTLLTQHPAEDTIFTLNGRSTTKIKAIEAGIPIRYVVRREARESQTASGLCVCESARPKLKVKDLFKYLLFTQIFNNNCNIL